MLCATVPKMQDVVDGASCAEHCSFCGHDETEALCGTNFTKAARGAATGPGDPGPPANPTRLFASCAERMRAV